MTTHIDANRRNTLLGPKRLARGDPLTIQVGGGLQKSAIASLSIEDVPFLGGKDDAAERWEVGKLVSRFFS